MNVTATKKTTATVTAVKNKFQNNNDLKAAFDGLFSPGDSIVELSHELRLFCKKIKIEHFKKMRQEIVDLGLDNDELVFIFRLVFGGKTNTLISRENESYNRVIHSDVRNIVKKIREEYLFNFTYKTEKTSGWVTSFINFSIEQIEMDMGEKDNKEFYSKFNKIFPELDDIIRKVSF